MSDQQPKTADASDLTSEENMRAWRKDVKERLAFLTKTAEELKRWADEAEKAQERRR